jgi:hypothetical protein
MQLKTSELKTNQLPLKGMSSKYKDERTGREFSIEGMGDGRYRIHTAKRQPRQK